MSSSTFLRDLARNQLSNESIFAKINRPAATIKGLKERDAFSTSQPYFQCLTVFSPDGTFTLVWGVVMILAIVYQILSVPFFLAFETNDTYISLSIDFVCTLVYMGDIAVTMNTSFYKKGMLVVSRRFIFQRYLKSWLIVDVVSSFPFGWVFQGPMTPTSGGNLRTPALLKVIKLSRIIRTLRLMRITKLRQHLTLLEQKLSNRFSIMFTVLYLCILMTTIAHWAACCFYYVSQTTDSVDSWAFVFQLQGASDLDRYVSALYWAITTLTTVGYGDIVPKSANERVFVIVIMILSAGVFSYLIGKIGTVISLIERESNEHKELVMNITRYLRAADVPEDVSYRALRYVDYVWETRKRRKVLDKRVLREFSEPLKNEISEHIFGSILHRVPMMNLFDNNFISQLARGVEPEIYAQDDVIFEMDQTNSEIYFLEKGKVELYHKDSQHTLALLQVGSMQPGHFFGEIAFFTGDNRSASARCLHFSELLSVKRDLLMNLMRLSPSAAYTLQVILDRYKTRNFTELGVECFLCKEQSHLARDCEQTKIKIDRETIKRKWMKKRQTPARILNLKENPKVTFLRRTRKVRMCRKYGLKNVKCQGEWEGMDRSVSEATPLKSPGLSSIRPRHLFFLNGMEVHGSGLKDEIDFTGLVFNKRGSAPTVQLPLFAPEDIGEVPSPPISPHRRFSILSGIKTYQLADELRRQSAPDAIPEDSSFSSSSNSDSSSDSQ